MLCFIEHYYQLKFDELNEFHDERLIALEKLVRQKERIAKFYDSRVKYKSFKVGDLVWKVILPIDKVVENMANGHPCGNDHLKLLKCFLEMLMLLSKLILVLIRVMASI